MFFSQMKKIKCFQKAVLFLIVYQALKVESYFVKEEIE